MKYWFFDGNDVVGPFSPQELLRRTDFSVWISLVCPENFSEDEDSWRPASSFADFRPSSAEESSSPAEKPATPNGAEPGDSSQEEAALFDKEVDTFLKNPSILAGTAEPAPDGPSLEIPKKPAKPGPIEDYFNNINGEDLGDILGIPDPNENSDMNLARALEKQFEQTTPPADKEIDAAEAVDEEPEPGEPSFPGEETSPSEDAVTPPAEQAAEQESGRPPVVSSAAAETVLAQESPAAPTRLDCSSVPPQPQPSACKTSEPIVAVPLADGGEEPFLMLPGEQKNGESALPEPETPLPDEPGQDAARTAQTPEPTPKERAPLPAEPEQEELSTCTLPVIRAGETSQLPVMPEDNRAFVLEPLPNSQPQEEFFPREEAPSAGPESKETLPLPEASEPHMSEMRPAEAEELVPSAAPLPAKETGKSTAESLETGPEGTESVRAPQQPAAAEDPKEQTVRDIMRGALTLPAEEELKEPLKTVPMTPEVNQVKPKLNQTPEIEQFLDTQSRVLRRAHNKKAGLMLWVLAALLALGVILAGLHFFASAVPEEKVSPAETPAPVQNPAVSVRAALEPSVQVPPPAAPVPPKPRPSATDRAMAAVQNHRLAGEKGTIASYFDRLYASQLAQGYTGVWSAEPLHKNIYIVKYRLSKTRMEPVVYVFQADAVQGKVTGALNNAALDLIGKI